MGTRQRVHQGNDNKRRSKHDPTRCKLATLTGAALALTVASVSGAAAQERVRWKMQSAFSSSLAHLGTSGVRFTENIDRVSGGSFRDQVLRAGRAGAGARVLRCRLQGLGRSPAGPRPATTPASIRRSRSSPRCRSARSTASSSPGRSSAAATSSRTRSMAARPVLDRRVRDRSRDLGLVPQRGRLARQPEGPEDALLRPRRQGHAEARRVDPAARRRRHLPGAGARRDRCHRVLDAQRWTSTSVSIRSPSSTTIPAGTSRSRSASC